MVDSTQDETIDVERVKDADHRVKKFLVENKGTAFKASRIQDELDDIDNHNIKSRQSLSTPHPFHEVNSKRIGSVYYYYADIDYFMVFMVAVTVLTCIVMAVAYALGYI